MNYLFNITGSWIANWLFLGTSAKSLDAHLIETDSAGSTAIAALDLGGTASSIRALTVNENTGAASSAATIDNSNPGGFGLIVTVASTIAAARGINSGSGAAIQGLNLGTGPGGSFTGSGSGSGVVAVGGASGAGLVATGNGPAVGAEIRALGTGSALFLERQTGATAAGLRIEVAGAGVPVRGELYLEPHANPSAPIDGEIWKTPGTAGFGRETSVAHDAAGRTAASGKAIDRAVS